MAISRIIRLLVEINIILDKHHVTKWFEILSNIQNRLEEAANNRNKKQMLLIMEEIRTLYRGMGSFNDLFITDQAGHEIAPEDISVVNSQLQTLQKELFLAAKDEIARLA